MARYHLDISIDLTAQELLAPLGGLIEIDDIVDYPLEPATLIDKAQADKPQVQAEIAVEDVLHDNDDSIEIELTAAQMDSILKDIVKP